MRYWGIAVFVAGGFFAGANAPAADWPQWRGPNRNDISLETGLLKKWPQGGPRLLNTYENAGAGFSGFAVVGDHLYTMGGRSGNEYVYAIDILSGKEVWSHQIGQLYVNGWGDGPRGTPTIDGSLVFALGGQGKLVCVDSASGKEHWHLDLLNDLDGEMPNWGYTESPLLDGDKLICTPGGSKGTVAALEKTTGKTLWRSKDLTDPAAYSSVVIAVIDGVRQYVQLTSQGVAGVAARDGRLLWHGPEGKNRTAVIPTPIVHDDFVFVTSGYGAGCALLKLAKEGMEMKEKVVYANKQMTNQHGGVILLGDYVYGYSDGRGWVCMELKTGKVAWTEKRKLGKGSITYADGHLYCYSEGEGTVVLIDANPAGWKEAGRFTIPRHTQEPRKRGQIWTHPVVANGNLFLRDQELIFRFDVKENEGGN